MKMCPQCLLQSFHEKYLGHLLFCQGGFVIFFTVCNKMLTFIKNANLIVKGQKTNTKTKRESVCVTTPHYSRIIINETKLCYRPDPTSSARSIFICCDLSQQERVFICRRCGLSKRKLLVKWKHTRPELIHCTVSQHSSLQSCLFTLMRSSASLLSLPAEWDTFLGLGCNWFLCKLRSVRRSADYLRMVFPHSLANARIQV